MKKIITLLAIVGVFSLQGCTTDENVVYEDSDTIAITYENQNPYDFTANNDFIVRFNFPTPIFTSDMILVYRLAGIDSLGKDVWEFLPETYYFDNGTRDFSYNFNFTNTYVDIYLNGNDLISVPLENRLDQIFRIVVVPADLVYAVDKNNYQEVMNTLKLKETQVQKIKL